MNLRALIEKLINIRNPGVLARLALCPLLAASLACRLVVVLKAALYRHSFLQSRHPGCSVIAVGNLTVGGTGKTPTVSLLARALNDRGYRVAVITRGYRGRATGTVQVVSDGSAVQASVADVGDETCMLARTLGGIPVLAGKDRVAAAKLAQERFRADVVLLDDGFQYHRLRRDLDIVLINAADPFGNGCLLPRGTLREPLSALSRADVLLITKCARSGSSGQLQGILRKHSPGARVFRSSVRPVGLRNAHTNASVSFAEVEGKRAAGLCSIGDPESFFATLRDFDVRVQARLIFPDHHAYTRRDYECIELGAGEVGTVITTEKDIAKINTHMLQNVRLFVLEIRQHVENLEGFLQVVTTAAGSLNGGPPADQRRR